MQVDRAGEGALGAATLPPARGLAIRPAAGCCLPLGAQDHQGARALDRGRAADHAFGRYGDTLEFERISASGRRA